MPLMSEMAFCVLPWPSAYLNDVTLAHLLASSLPDAVVTSRQLLPPNPSRSANETFFVPHQSGAPARWVTLPLSPPLPLPPELEAQPATASRTAAAAAAPGRIVRTFMGRSFLEARQGCAVVVGRERPQAVVGAPRSPGRRDQSARQFTV